MLLRPNSFFDGIFLSSSKRVTAQSSSLTRQSHVPGWLFLLLAFLAIQGSISPLRAESAKSYFKAGKHAEIREDYITAYQDYRQAWLEKPQDMQYKESYQRLRFLAASQYLDLGRKLLEQGQLNDALTDFLRALAIDPSYEAAQQEVNRTRTQINGANAAPNPDEDALTSKQARQQMQEMAGPLHLKPLSDTPITIHAVEDTKVIYQTIGKIAGINILFDPDYTSKRIPIDLHQVTLYDALRSVGFVSQTFWRPVTSDTIFVAADTRQKRTELEEQAVQTFYLGNVTQANDLNEVLNAVRNLMDTSVKMQAVPSQNAIVMRGTPDQLLLAQKIIDDLDKTKPEVVVDIAVLEVNKDLLRDIGVQLPGTISVQLQSSTATPTTPTTGNTGTTSTPTPSTSSGLTVNDLGSLNATNFGVSIGQATLNMLLTDSDTRVLQNPQLRAVDGEKATLKIGSKVPIATGSFSPGAGIAAAGISPLVSTQFSYIDVGVNIEMQPTIHYDGDVSMKLHIVVSNITNYVNLGGITQPVIGQQDLQQNIRMREGSANLLGGILQHTESKTIGGTPGLGEIPLLKYLFSDQKTEMVNDEVVFVLIPHLVRRIDLSPLNLRTIDTGTGTNVSLRMERPVPASAGVITRNGLAPLTFEPSTPPAEMPATAAEAATQAAGQMEQAVRNAGENPAPVPSGNSAAGAPLQLSLSPQQGIHKVGSTFQMQVNLAGGKDVFSVPMQLHYDSKLLNLLNVDTGNLLAKDGQTTALVHRDDGNGDVTISASRPPGVHGVNGNGNVCVLTFQAKAPGDATVQVIKSAARNSAQTVLPIIAGSPATVHVQ